MTLEHRYDATFLSPLRLELPSNVRFSLYKTFIYMLMTRCKHTQQQVQLGHVRLILPSTQKLQGLVLLTAATGEETYQDRERRFAKPLSEHGVGVLMLTMPFYGTRRPSGQVECYIRTVSEYMLQYVCICI